MAQPIQSTGSLSTDIKQVANKIGKGQTENPNGVLGKDEFLKLLLVELEHQDPTAPVETDKILSQTSQLASLEAATNTNSALQKLSGSLTSSLKFTTINAMGKIADMGNDEVILKENDTVAFEMFMPRSAEKGTIHIKDTHGNVARTIQIGETKKGVNAFSWDGETNEGVRADEGSYHVTATYVDKKGANGTTSVGVYPISSIKFENGQSMMKLGTQYVPFNAVKEIYDADS